MDLGVLANVSAAATAWGLLTSQLQSVGYCGCKSGSMLVESWMKEIGEKDMAFPLLLSEVQRPSPPCNMQIHLLLLHLLMQPVQTNLQVC